MNPNSSALPALLLALAALAPPAAAAEVLLVGVFGDKAAILAVDGGTPRTVKVGQKLGDITLISVDKDRATIESGGKRSVLLRGQTYSSTGGSSEHQSATLAAGAGGHFITEGAVNGGQVRFLVDTGATMIALPASDAIRLGISYRRGDVTTVQTAGGPTSAYRVKFDSVRVGGIELSNVDGVVVESGLPVALLGMTFLNRVEMTRDGDRMTLMRRY